MTLILSLSLPSLYDDVVYHVFQQGELEQLVDEAAREVAQSSITNVQVHCELSGWEKGNWYGIWRCTEQGNTSG